MGNRRRQHQHQPALQDTRARDGVGATIALACTRERRRLGAFALFPREQNQACAEAVKWRQVAKRPDLNQRQSKGDEHADQDDSERNACF
jgi:hypothetical protein